MAVKAMSAPSGARRKPKYPVTDKELETAVQLLDKGETPGVGPFPTEREARSAAQFLKRLVCENSQWEPEQIATRAWTDDDEQGYCILRVRTN